MITAPALQRIAAGGISNSLAAVDLAQVAQEAVAVCHHAYRLVQEVRPGGVWENRTFTADEVCKILSGLIAPLDNKLAEVLDVGDGRSVKQAYDEAKANGELE